MAKIVLIRGCGPMVCSSYAETTAAIDRAYAVPNRPMQWRGILASLADGLVRGFHPLQDMAEMEQELKVVAPSPPLPTREKSVLPSLD